MIRKEITILNEKGLHERLALMIIKKASTYKAEILITKGNAKMNAKSILGFFSLGISKGDIIGIEVNGENEENVIEELAQYILSLN